MESQRQREQTSLPFHVSAQESVLSQKQLLREEQGRWWICRAACRGNPKSWRVKAAVLCRSDASYTDLDSARARHHSVLPTVNVNFPKFNTSGFTAHLTALCVSIPSVARVPSSSRWFASGGTNTTRAPSTVWPGATVDNCWPPAPMISLSKCCLSMQTAATPQVMSF